MKVWKQIVHANENQQKAGVAIFISDEIDFQTKTVIRDKGGHYIMIKESLQQEDITFEDIYAPNIDLPKYIKHTLTDPEREINGNTTIVGDFNTPLTSKNRSSRQKINKKILVLNDTLA